MQTIDRQAITQALRLFPEAGFRCGCSEGDRPAKIMPFGNKVVLSQDSTSFAAHGKYFWSMNRLQLDPFLLYHASLRLPTADIR
jgi:hypothetical protein